MNRSSESYQTFMMLMLLRRQTRLSSGPSLKTAPETSGINAIAMMAVIKTNILAIIRSFCSSIKHKEGIMRPIKVKFEL